MSKYPILLLIAGLGLGLWLGFYPPAHNATVKFWDSVRTSEAQAQPKADSNGPSLSSRVSAWLRSVRVAQPAAAPRSTSATGQRVSTALQTFWNSLHTAWVKFIAQFKQARL